MEREKLLRFARLAPKWLEFFRKASVQVKKAMLSHVIDRIILWRDRIEIRYSVSLAELSRAVRKGEGEGRLEARAVVEV